MHSLNQRSNYDSVFHKNKEHNFYLFGAMAVSAAIALAVLLIPPLQGFFKFVSLGWKEWLIAIGLSLFPLVAVRSARSSCALRENENPYKKCGRCALRFFYDEI